MQTHKRHTRSLFGVTQLEKQSSKREVLDGLSKLGRAGENECDKRHGRAGSTWATGHLTPQVPSSPASQALQPGKCYELRVWKTSVPQTSSGDSCKEEEGAFLSSCRKQPLALSAGHSEVGQGREQNVDGRRQRHLRTLCTDLSLQLAFDFPPGGRGGKTGEGHPVKVECVDGKGAYFPP